MVKVRALTEFSEEEIMAQREKAKSDPDPEMRKKALRFKMEMEAYNARALRGDFDSY